MRLRHDPRECPQPPRQHHPQLRANANSSLHINLLDGQLRFVPALPEPLSLAASAPVATAVLSLGPLLKQELPDPLLPAVLSFSTVTQGGMLWSLSQAYDAAFRELPVLTCMEWQILAQLEFRGLLSGDELTRVGVGLQIKDLPLEYRVALKTLIDIDPCQPVDPLTLSAASVLLL